jgi:hypothetical protein
LNINFLKLMIFIDAFFANVNLHSQIDYVICLIDDVKANIIHWFFTKCKRVIRNVLAAKLYAMTNEFDADLVIKSIIQRIFNIFLSMILLTDKITLWLSRQAWNHVRKAIDDRSDVSSSILRTKRDHEDSMNWWRYKFDRCNDED